VAAEAHSVAVAQEGAPTVVKNPICMNGRAKGREEISLDEGKKNSRVAGEGTYSSAGSTRGAELEGSSITEDSGDDGNSSRFSNNRANIHAFRVDGRGDERLQGGGGGGGGIRIIFLRGTSRACNQLLIGRSSRPKALNKIVLAIGEEAEGAIAKDVDGH